MKREKMTDFLLRFRDVTGGLQDGLRESPFAASVPEPSVDFFRRAKSVRPFQTILCTAEHIRREVLPVGFIFADGLKQTENAEEMLFEALVLEVDVHNVVVVVVVNVCS